MRSPNINVKTKWKLGIQVISHSYTYYFPDSVLKKLKVTHKNTTLWSFSSYFLFPVWLKFHIVFIFLHSLRPRTETTECFQWKAGYCITLPGWCQLVPVWTVFVAFCWSDIILLVFTSARIVPVFCLLAPNPWKGHVQFNQWPSTHALRGVWFLEGMTKSGDVQLFTFSPHSQHLWSPSSYRLVDQRVIVNHRWTFIIVYR